MANRWENWKQWQTLLGSKITAYGDCSHEMKRYLLLGRKAMTNLDSRLKKHYFADKGPSSQSYGFSSGHVWMWDLDQKESWVLKNWSFWTVVSKKTLESHLESKKIQPVHPEGNQSWMFIGSTDAEAAMSVLWSCDGKKWHIWKDPDLGKDWRLDEKDPTEHEVVRWHHWLNGHRSE